MPPSIVTIAEQITHLTDLVPSDEPHEDVEEAPRRPILEEAEILGELAPLQLGEDHEDAKQDAVHTKQDAASWRGTASEGKGVQKTASVRGSTASSVSTVSRQTRGAKTK